MSAAKLPGLDKLREHRERADRGSSEPEATILPGAPSTGEPNSEAPSQNEARRGPRGDPAFVSVGPVAERSVPTGGGAGRRRARRDTGRRGPVLAAPSGTGVHMHARVSLDLLDELERRLDSLRMSDGAERVSKRNLLAALVDDLCHEERVAELRQLLEGYRTSGETRADARHRVSTEVPPTVHQAFRASLRRLRREMPESRATQVEVLSALVWHAARQLTQTQLSGRYGQGQPRAS